MQEKASVDTAGKGCRQATGDRPVGSSPWEADRVGPWPLWHTDHSWLVLTLARGNMLSWDPRFSLWQGRHACSQVSGAGLEAH